MRYRTTLSPSLVLALVALTALAVALPAAAADPWQALDTVRDRLGDGAQSARFEQLYVPAGFSTGESESGTLTLAIPDCLRWDYAEPYPKSFLVCGDVAYYWNPDDGTGRRQSIDRRNEPGLDLLLLSREQLSGRYEARAEELDGAVAVHLTPRVPVPEVTSATLTLEPASGRVTALEYEDTEGNRTRFVMTAYRPLADPSGVFTPPAGIEWIDD